VAEMDLVKVRGIDYVKFPRLNANNELFTEKGMFTRMITVIWFVPGIR
jgi:hypothetical protein